MPELSRQTGPVYSRHAADPDYAEILAIFVDSVHDQRQALRDALDRESFEELRTLAHQLKGAGGGYGFDGLSQHAAALEQACRLGGPLDVVAALEELTAYMARMDA